MDRNENDSRPQISSDEFNDPKPDYKKNSGKNEFFTTVQKSFSLRKFFAGNDHNSDLKSCLSINFCHGSADG
jgi:hypothetical protein